MSNFTVKIKQYHSEYEDVIPAENWVDAFGISIMKLTRHPIESIRIIRHGSHPFGDEVVGEWREGKWKA